MRLLLAFGNGHLLLSQFFSLQMWRMDGKEGVRIFDDARRRFEMDRDKRKADTGEGSHQKSRWHLGHARGSTQDTDNLPQASLLVSVKCELAAITILIWQLCSYSD
eukprot:scpid98840/ scgid0118/ 